MENVKILSATSSNQHNAKVNTVIDKPEASSSSPNIQQECSQTKINQPCLTIEQHLNEFSETDLRTTRFARRSSLMPNFHERFLKHVQKQRIQQLRNEGPKFDMKPKHKDDKGKLAEKSVLPEVFNINVPSSMNFMDTSDITKTTSALGSQKSLQINTTKSVRDVLSKYADPIKADSTGQRNTSYGFKQRLKPMVIKRKTMFTSIHDILKEPFSRDRLKATLSQDKIESLLKAEQPWKVDTSNENPLRKKQSKENLTPLSSSDHFHKVQNHNVHKDKKHIALHRNTIQKPSPEADQNSTRKSINIVYVKPMLSQKVRDAVESTEDQDIESLKKSSKTSNSLKNFIKKPFNMPKTASLRGDLQENIKSLINPEEVVNKMAISNQSIEKKSRTPEGQVEINENTNVKSQSSVESSLKISNSGSKREIVQEKTNKNAKQKGSSRGKLESKVASKKSSANSKGQVEINENTNVKSQSSVESTLKISNSGSEREIVKEKTNKNVKQKGSSRGKLESKVASKKSSANSKGQVEINENTNVKSQSSVESTLKISNSESKREIVQEKTNKNAKQKGSSRGKLESKVASKKSSANSNPKKLSLIFNKITSDQNSGSELNISTNNISKNAEQKHNLRESLKSNATIEESYVSSINLRANIVGKNIKKKKIVEHYSKSAPENVKKIIPKNAKQKRRSREKLKQSAKSKKTPPNSKAKKIREINDKSISYHYSGRPSKASKEDINEKLEVIFDKTTPGQHSRELKILKENINKNADQSNISRESIRSNTNFEESIVNVVHFRTMNVKKMNVKKMNDKKIPDHHTKSAPESVKKNITKNVKQKRRSREKLKTTSKSKKGLSNSKITDIFDKSISYHYSGSDSEISKQKIHFDKNENSHETHKTSSESEKSVLSEIGSEHSSKGMNKSIEQKKISHESLKSNTELKKSLSNSKTKNITNIIDKKVPEYSEYSVSEPKTSKSKKKIKQKLICGRTFREKSNTNARAKEKIIPLKKTLHKAQSKENVNVKKIIDLKNYPDSDAIKQLRRTLKLKAPWRSNSWTLEDAFHKRKQYEAYVLAHQYLQWKRKRELRNVLKEQEKANMNEVPNNIVPNRRKSRRKQRQSSEVACFRKNKYKDPTALLNYYKCQWDRFQTKFPGEAVHSELRQVIHEKMQTQPNFQK